MPPAIAAALATTGHESLVEGGGSNGFVGTTNACAGTGVGGSSGATSGSKLNFSDL
jgi:hypothetical protein